MSRVVARTNDRRGRTQVTIMANTTLAKVRLVANARGIIGTADPIGIAAPCEAGQAPASSSVVVRPSSHRPPPTRITAVQAAIRASTPATLAVEDSRTGATSARAAGLVVAGYGPLAWEKHEVTFVVESLSEIVDRFGRAN